MTHLIGQSPSELLDYELDYTIVLAGDTISTSAWAVNPVGGATISNNSSTSATTTIWITGGAIGVPAEIINTVTTAAGRIFQDSLTLVPISI